PASEIYVGMKLKKSQEVGMDGSLHRLPENVKQEGVIKLIEELNSDNNVNGILVQLPLPKHLNERKILDTISPEKDVDGLTTLNMGNLFSGSAAFEPCTPKGIIKMLDAEGFEFEGKNAVVIGRSNIVGKPIAMMLMKKNATVTMCHSRTKNLSDHTKNADILVVAIGKSKFITEDMVKTGATVIDVGMNRTDKGLFGDVDFEKVKEKTHFITPVPGGVGPLTVAMVLENTIISAERKL
ncbi:MAG: bifunctional 5,10-methylenetetrahydrofolate dehydrogenase/5,10-methenyltetrahydrofolate cyclohydrolase, partial [Candidatus Aenigmarchaeota archaeon]|nr:bifunctional 5,10-methylenetetrahydrofolate dehydrogenase/5,10-methenyltetrahydrofolate cyclohydrolase [Candidatus Aenigmarchaeota archaeon]